MPLRTCPPGPAWMTSAPPEVSIFTTLGATLRAAAFMSCSACSLSGSSPAGWAARGTATRANRANAARNRGRGRVMVGGSLLFLPRVFAERQIDGHEFVAAADFELQCGARTGLL